MLYNVIDRKWGAICMKLEINENENYLFEMANVLGRKVKVPHKLPFSFFFSSDKGVSHSIRVKPVFNSEKLLRSQTGTLKLCDDWEFIPGENDTKVSQKDIDDMKQFFRDYLVLFCMAWDEQLTYDDVQDYFKAEITFNELLHNISFYTDEMNSIITIAELEEYCRKNNMVNFYGN